MTTVLMSPKHQIVIPKEIRDELKLKPGQKFVVLRDGRSVRLVPVPPLEELRGSLKGVDVEFVREKEDRAL